MVTVEAISVYSPNESRKRIQVESGKDNDTESSTVRTFFFNNIWEINEVRLISGGKLKIVMMSQTVITNIRSKWGQFDTIQLALRFFEQGRFYFGEASVRCRNCE